MLQTFPMVLENSIASQTKANLMVSLQNNRTTSLGREEPHVLVELKPENSTTAPNYESGILKNNQSPSQNMVLFEDGRLEPDSEYWSQPPQGFHRMEFLDGISLVTLDQPQKTESASTATALALDVPEKLNLDCDLQNGGTISIHNKIEGDIRLRTMGGDIVVKRLRGHIIDIEARGEGAHIFSEELLEAESLRVSLPNSGRFRAKRIHASTLDVDIGKDHEATTDIAMADDDKTTLFDSDDAGAICDIGSLYVTGDATVNVKAPGNTRHAVNIKSNHGHVTVLASQPLPETKNLITGEDLPIVEMGGVNGSCEVYVKKDNDASEAMGDMVERVSCRVHFDSIAPDSVSILQSGMGDIHVSIDRKVETDLRLLSSSNASSVDIDTFLLDDSDEDYEEYIRMLNDMNESSIARHNNPIRIETQTFTEKNGPKFDKLSLLDGWVENKSEEPDSRFDRKIRGEAGSIGKIRLDGAANQALKGFQGGEGKDCTSFIRPMVAVVATNSIVLETLSWLGNIARRYGLDEKRSQDDLGRQATRRARLPEAPKQ